MNEIELQRYLIENYPQENTSCEWKEMCNLKNDFNGKEKDDVISYVSALANMEGGHLVIGVKDKSLEIVGTNPYHYTTQNATMKLKDFCANLSSEGLRIEEFKTDDTNKIVWVIHVPKHQPQLPVYAHSKAWQRIEDSLVLMTKERLDAILSERIVDEDWSAKVIDDATIEDLDVQAIVLAREKYKELYPEKAQEVDSWDDVKFLNKAHILSKGKITNTAIILLGKEESEHLISPAVCKIRWILKDGGDENKDFRIFSIPMIRAVEELRSLIRNTTYTYTISGSLFPETMKRYDVFTLREPLCNAIAHQDYSRHARIEVVEYEDSKLVFRNYGQFIPKSIEDVVQNDFPESEYRNRFLVEAMRNIKMVETEGGGIRKLFVQQKNRFFPMPQYDLSNAMVVCEVCGNVIDENFARILANNPDLSLAEIMLLDRVQKHLPINDDAIALLRKRKYIEGRKPNFYLSSKLADQSSVVGLKSTYIRNKSFDDKYFKKLIVEYITKFKKASRQEINSLLMGKLPEALTETQKENKITNLLSALKREHVIINGQHREWFLVK